MKRRKAKKNWIIASVSAVVVTIVGLVVFGLSQTQPSSNEPTKLETPKNFEYTMNVTIKERETQHLFSWDIANNATGYKIIIKGETEDAIEKEVDKYTQEYNIADWVTEDENYTVSLVALGDGEDYLTSETAEISFKAEVATEGLVYKIYDGEYEVTKGNAGSPSRIVLPDTFNGSSVKKISDYAFGNPKDAWPVEQPYLKSVRFPKNLEVIGIRAFDMCSNLGKIEIPETVTEIGAHAFQGCSKLQTNIPSKLTRIEEWTFEGCESLENVELPKNLTYIGVAAFQDTPFTKIKIPDSVKHIGDAAFLQMIPLGGKARGLEAVEFSENLRLDFMGASVFRGTKWYETQPDGYICFNNMLYCYKGEMPENTVITSFPEGITRIASRAFEECENLISVTIPEGWETVTGEYVFNKCTSLKTVNLPNSLKRIELSTFRNCTALEEISLPYGLEEIGTYAFGACSSLTSIEIPDSVTSIGADAFTGCQNLERVVLSKNIKVLDEYVFAYCEKLMFLEIPDSVEKIGLCCIYNTAIESVILSKNVKEMDIYAFDNEKTKAVYYEGTKEEWNNILRYSVSYSGYIPLTYYYFETEPPMNSDGTGYDGNYWYYGDDGVPVVWEYQAEE